MAEAVEEDKEVEARLSARVEIPLPVTGSFSIFSMFSGMVEAGGRS